MMSRHIIRIILVAYIASTIFAADNLLHLVHADRWNRKIIAGEKIQHLIGHVEAYQDTLKIFCDELIFYEDKDIADFIGNVLIDDSHHKLWADKIIYHSNSRIADCLGHVKISGVNDSLYAEKFIYQFRGGNADAEKNLFIWDKQNNVRIWGDSGQYISNSRESHVVGNAYFQQLESNQSDTLVITARLLSYYGIDPKKAIAKDSVRIFKGDVRAACDSATYFVNDQLVSLRINPLAWQAESEMNGKMIDFSLDSLKIKEIFLYEKAKIVTLADSIEKKYNILKGKSIQVSMADGRPDRVIARSNAISVYQIEEDKVKQGTNSASSDSIIVYFKEGEADSISIIGGAEGTFYPADWKGEIKSEY